MVPRSVLRLLCGHKFCCLDIYISIKSELVRVNITIATTNYNEGDSKTKNNWKQ
jgi:hypothetical protein